MNKPTPPPSTGRKDRPFSHLVPSSPMGLRLMEMFQLLYERFGPQHWWPGESALEVMVGAVLTQNTNWANVEKAIENLKTQGLLSLEALSRVGPQEVARAIRPAGYYNLKARRLKALVDHVLDRAGTDLERFLAQPADRLREGLLSVRGIGPETADSIGLYAAGYPVFVVDAYTFRILYRHNLAGESEGYEQLQSLFMDHLPADAGLFNEFHALMVRTGKEFCRRKPLCASCPLGSWERQEEFPSR